MMNEKKTKTKSKEVTHKETGDMGTIAPNELMLKLVEQGATHTEALRNLTMIVDKLQNTITETNTKIQERLATTETLNKVQDEKIESHEKRLNAAAKERETAVTERATMRAEIEVLKVRWAMITGGVAIISSIASSIVVYFIIRAFGG